uniref:Serpentine receptor class gamma n=1 Tax=Meloidogyne incognita TaxID=6306 RepID=A0A914NFT0_MELIC
MYIEYVQNWITLLCHFITVSTMCPILIAIKFGKGLRIKELSPGLRLFFCSHVIFSILGIPYQLYRILFWISPNHETIANNYGNQYSPYLLFWLSMPEFVFYGAIPSVVLLLTVERCIALRITLTWVNKTYRWISLAIFMAIVGVNMLGHLLELPLFDDNPELIPICETASCTTTNWRLYFQLTSRIVLSSANVVMSIVFLLLLHQTGAAKKLKNRVILFTLFVEFALGVVPTFTAMIFNKVNLG